MCNNAISHATVIPQLPYPMVPRAGRPRLPWAARATVARLLQVLQRSQHGRRPFCREVSLYHMLQARNFKRSNVFHLHIMIVFKGCILTHETCDETCDTHVASWHLPYSTEHYSCKKITEALFFSHSGQVFFIVHPLYFAIQTCSSPSQDGANSHSSSSKQEFNDQSQAVFPLTWRKRVGRWRARCSQHRRASRLLPWPRPLEGTAATDETRPASGLDANHNYCNCLMYRSVPCKFR